MSFLFTFLAVVLFLVGLFVLMENQTVGLMILGAAIACVVISCCANKRKEQIKITQNPQIKLGRKRYSQKGYCLSGLPFGECDCEVVVYDNMVAFLSGKNVSYLDASKIISAAVRTKSELTGASTGSAILGTALFGMVGAIIASRPKNKSQYILVINYMNGGYTYAIAIAFDDHQKYDAENIALFLNKNTAGSVTQL